MDSEWEALLRARSARRKADSPRRNGAEKSGTRGGHARVSRACRSRGRKSILDRGSALFCRDRLDTAATCRPARDRSVDSSTASARLPLLQLRSSAVNPLSPSSPEIMSTSSRLPSPSSASRWQQAARRMRRAAVRRRRPSVSARASRQKTMRCWKICPNDRFSSSGNRLTRRPASCAIALGRLALLLTVMRATSAVSLRWASG